VSLRVANIAEAAIGRLSVEGSSGFCLRAGAALWTQLPPRISPEFITAFRYANAIDGWAREVRSPRKRQLIRALGLTLIAELAERGEL
jgi:hypothetical protein